MPFRIETIEAPKRTIDIIGDISGDISGFAGKAPWLKLPPREDFSGRPSVIAHREREARGEE